METVSVATYVTADGFRQIADRLPCGHRQSAEWKVGRRKCRESGVSDVGAAAGCQNWVCVVGSRSGRGLMGAAVGCWEWFARSRSGRGLSGLGAAAGFRKQERLWTIGSGSGMSESGAAADVQKWGGHRLSEREQPWVIGIGSGHGLSSEWKADDGNVRNADGSLAIKASADSCRTDRGQCSARKGLSAHKTH